MTSLVARTICMGSNVYVEERMGWCGFLLKNMSPTHNYPNFNHLSSYCFACFASVCVCVCVHACVCVRACICEVR